MFSKLAEVTFSHFPCPHFVGFARIRLNFVFLAKSWTFQAAPTEVVCVSRLSQKVGFRKVVFSPAHVEKVQVFVDVETS